MVPGVVALALEDDKRSNADSYATQRVVAVWVMPSDSVM